MPRSRTKIAGFAFIGVGVVLFGVWYSWIATRTSRPVNVPISLVPGPLHASEFKVNLDALYTIDIEVEKKIPFDTLNCLLGTAMPSPTSSALGECPDRPSVVVATWALTSEGQTVARGSSDESRSGAWGNDSISREIGHLKSQSGRPYRLDVDFLKDGSALAPGNPRLKVEVHPMFYEDTMVGGAVMNLLSVVLIAIGVVLLVVSLFKSRRARNSTAPTT